MPRWNAPWHEVLALAVEALEGSGPALDDEVAVLSSVTSGGLRRLKCLALKHEVVRKAK
jgi:hypothetical protein